jgi:hypothetical protein
MTKCFGPEIMVAAAERAEKSTGNVGKAAVASKKMGFQASGSEGSNWKTRGHRSNNEVGHGFLESSVPSFHGYGRPLVSYTSR